MTVVSDAARQIGAVDDATDDEPTSVEDFVQRAATRTDKPSRTRKEADAPLSIREQFDARLRKATDPVDFVHPHLDGLTVQCKAITIAKRNELTTMATRGDGTVDAWALECLFASEGLVNPRYSPQELAEMPELFVDPIYFKVMELTNGRRQIGAQAADGPTPLAQTSGSAPFWQIGTTGTAKK